MNDYFGKIRKKTNMIKRRVRRFIVAILCLAMLLPNYSVTAMATEYNYETTAVVENHIDDNIATMTRAEWLYRLAQTFEMSVEDDNYPDNYFSDLDSSSEYYYAVLLNVEFGVIDVETGGEVRPDDLVTREFAAHTLNYCLGYRVQENMVVVCSDIDTSVYRDDLYIAIERGWFELVDGNVFPKQSITSTEAERMLADAEAILLSMEVDAGSEKSFELADDVIVVTREGEVSNNEDGTSTITITDLQQNITVGDRFAIYKNEIPTVYLAQSISTQNNDTVIVANIDESGTAFVSVIAEDIVSASVIDVEALDGAELVFVNEETKEEFVSADQIVALYGSNSKELINSTVVVKKEIDFGDGLSGSVELKLKNAKVTYDIQYLDVSAYAYLECDTELTFSGEFDAGNFSPIQDLRLVNWTVPGVGGFVISVDLDMQASMSGIHKGYLKSGIAVSQSSGVRLIHGFHAKAFSIVAEAQVDLGLKAKFGITDLPVLKAYVYAGVGGKAEISRTEWNDSDLPLICVDFKAHLYANYGYEGSVKFAVFKINFADEISLIDETNSPIRCVKHYDDGVEVEVCGRDQEEEEGGSEPVRKRYVTPASSSWSGSYWNKGTQSSGKDSGGNVIPTYQYSVNSDGKSVTITGYNGNTTSLIIPSTLDGYTVTGIGRNVFSNKIKIKKVTMPDSIITIERYAFYGCSNLESISLSSNLKNLEANAFGDCDLLEVITIPKSLEKATTWVDSFDGPFENCDGLKKIIFEDGMTQIPANLFVSCTGIQNVEVPDTVTIINQHAFGACTNLRKVKLSQNITKISVNAFANCTKLEEINLPSRLQFLGGDSFYNCDSLAEITIPKSLTEASTWFDSYGGAFKDCDGLKKVSFEEGTTAVVSNLFAGCTGIEEVEIPNTVTIIGKGAFLGCTSLKKVEMDNNVVEIQNSAFSNCDALISITIPNSLTSIGSQAFYDCDNLQQVIIPDSVTTIGTNIFESCDMLSNVSMGIGLTTIPDYAFADCSKLASVVIPRNVTQIGNYAFKNGTSLTEITIPQKTTRISSNAFSYPYLMTVYGVLGSYAETYALENGMNFVAGSVPAQSVSLPQNTYTLKRGDTVTIIPTITPSDFTDSVNWESSNTSVATIDQNGKVKAVREGTAIISVYVGNVSGSCTVNVVGNISNPTPTPDEPTPSPTPNPNNPTPAPKPSGDWPFSDVTIKSGNWKYEAVKYVYDNNIMNGVGDGTRFDPDAPLTREMFATVLYRMAGEPAVTYTRKFSDVPQGKWYSSAVIWASDKGIVGGYGDGRFGTGDSITREQIAKMLMEYGKMQGYDVSQSASFESFADASSVSGWAKEYMSWAVGSGMISGKTVGGKLCLDPKGNATRAESATMLKRFMEKY